MDHYSRYAFFDLDGTLIADTSLMTFYSYYLRAEFGARAPGLGKEILEAVTARRKAGIERDELNAWFYERYFAGLEAARLRELAQGWLAAREADAGFYQAALVARVHAYRAQGVGTVLVTGSFREVAEAVAARLGIAACLSAPLEEVDGRYTGAMTGAPMIGAAKAAAVLAFLRQRHVAPGQCFGYGDDHTDIDFLAVLGRPRALASGSPALLAHARRGGWPVIDPASAIGATISTTQGVPDSATIDE